MVVRKEVSGITVKELISLLSEEKINNDKVVKISLKDPDTNQLSFVNVKSVTVNKTLIVLDVSGEM